MADKFDPYHKWLGIPPRDQPPHHYRLLSIDLFESDPEVIDAAARRLAVYVKSCASGPHQAEAKKLLTEIVQARHCLLDPQLRAAYDQRLTAPPPGAPPIEMAPAIETAPARGPAKPAAPTKSTAAAGDATRRAKRGPGAPAVAQALPLAAAPVPAPPAPPPADSHRHHTPAVADLPNGEPPSGEAPPLDAPVADTPTEPLDTLMDMPVGITTLPDPTPIGKGHKSGSHKSGGHKSAAKSGAHKSTALAAAPLPGTKGKRRKRNQISPMFVLLGLLGAALAAGIVFAVFRGHPDETPVADARSKTPDPPPAETRPEEPPAAKRSDAPAASDEAPADESATFEDDEQPAKNPASPTKGPAVPRSRTSSASLLEAIEQDGTVAAVQKLIAAGADASTKDKDGRSALRLAVVKGRVDLVKVLLAAKANPNSADALGETPLMSAAKIGNAPIVKLLLEAGANPNVQTSAPLAPVKSAGTSR